MPTGCFIQWKLLCFRSTMTSFSILTRSNMLMVMLDLTPAFETVNQEELQAIRFTTYGIRGNAHRWIQYHLTDNSLSQSKESILVSKKKTPRFHRDPSWDPICMRIIQLLQLVPYVGSMILYCRYRYFS